MIMQQPVHYLVKGITLGSSGAGKTTYLDRVKIEHLSYYANSRKRDHSAVHDNSKLDVIPMATVGVDLKVLKHELTNTGNTIKVQMYDTGGQERFATVVNSYLSNVSKFIIVYAAGDELSYNQARMWLENIGRIKTERSRTSATKLVVMVLENKIDQCPNDIEKRQEISTLCEERGHLFFSISAKEGLYVMESWDLFLQMCSQADQHNLPQPVPKYTTQLADDSTDEFLVQRKRKCPLFSCC